MKEAIARENKTLDGKLDLQSTHKVFFFELVYQLFTRGSFFCRCTFCSEALVFCSSALEQVATEATFRQPPTVAVCAMLCALGSTRAKATWFA
jgi:hypothetical protein